MKLTFEFVLWLHDRLIDEYGGVKGVLNEGLLHSALEMPKAQFNGKDLHRTVYDKAAAYLFHLIQNYPFVDGNKRTASMVTLVFLAANSKSELTIDSQEYEKIILKTAQGKISKKEIATFLRKKKRH